MGQYDSDCTFKRSDTRRASRRRLTLIQRGPRHAMTNAVLLRNLPLMVRDVSSSGCLIESSAPLQVGTVGWLEVEFEGERRFEWFRIARVHTRGESAFLAGVEFLPLAAAGADSLRSAIGRLRRSTPAMGSAEAGWTIVCGYREQCTRGRRGASRISLADRRFCQENRGFLSTTLAAHFWQRRCS